MVDAVACVVHLSLHNGDKVEAFIDLLWWEGTLVKPAGGRTFIHPFSFSLASAALSRSRSIPQTKIFILGRFVPKVLSLSQLYFEGAEGKRLRNPRVM